MVDGRFKTLVDEKIFIVNEINWSHFKELGIRFNIEYQD